MSVATKKWRWCFALASACAGLVSSIPASRADDLKQTCSATYQATQTARKDGKLRLAREKVIQCSQDGCPRFIKSDCAQWLTEIDASLPTAVFEARDAQGNETSDVRVLFDGDLVKERLDGKAIALDPGEHVLRFELAGSDPIERKITIREGEKNRSIAVAFGKPAAEPATPAPDATPDASDPKRGPLVGGIVVGALSVAGFSLFATFGALGLKQRNDLETSCKPHCTDDQVAPIRTKFLIGDISLGVGIAAAGVATYLFIASRPSAPPKTSAGVHFFSAAPIPGGAAGALAGSF